MIEGKLWGCKPLVDESIFSGPSHKDTVDIVRFVSLFQKGRINETPIRKYYIS